MKKFLPKTRFTPQGFTLIELMIVISIIAILSVVGMVIYSSVQKNARDARRRADIQSISKALETHYVNGTYAANDPSWYSSGSVPIPPEGGNYTGIPSASATSFNVCASLEGTTTSYCIKSSQ